MDDFYRDLGIMTPEAEAVQRILAPAAPPERQAYASPEAQAYGDYATGLETARDDRAQSARAAELQRFIQHPTAMGQRARTSAWQEALQKAQYEKQTSQLMSELSQLDPGDPEHLVHQDEVIARHPIAREALKDPRLSTLVKRQAADNAEMQELFDKDPLARQEYASLRAENLAPGAAKQKVKEGFKRREDRLWFAANGGDPAEFDGGRFNDPTGRPDRAAMAYHLAQKKREQDSLLGSTERKALDEAVKAVEGRPVLNPDSEDDKRRTFRLATGKDPSSDEEWARAYSLVQQATTQNREAEMLGALIDEFEQSGKRVPEIYRRLAGRGTPNVPRGTSPEETAAPVQPQGATVVTTRAQYDALPSGAIYSSADGKKYRKK